MAVPPLCRHLEPPGPQAEPFGARGRLVRAKRPLAILGVINRPAAPHHGGVNHPVFGTAHRDDAAVSVAVALLALDLLPARQLAQNSGRVPAALIGLAAAALARLFPLRGIHSPEPDVGAGDDNGVAVDDPGGTDDVGGCRRPRDACDEDECRYVAGQPVHPSPQEIVLSQAGEREIELRFGFCRRIVAM